MYKGKTHINKAHIIVNYVKHSVAYVITRLMTKLPSFFFWNWKILNDFSPL